MKMSETTPASLRLYVGGFPTGTPVVSISRLFERMRDVVRVEEVSHSGTNAYCHIQLVLAVAKDDENKAAAIRDKIIKVYNKTKWKGGKLIVAEAKCDKFAVETKGGSERQNNSNSMVPMQEEDETSEAANTISSRGREWDMLRLRKKRGRRGVFLVSSDKDKCITGKKTTTFSVDDEEVSANVNWCTMDTFQRVEHNLLESKVLGISSTSGDSDSDSDSDSLDKQKRGLETEYEVRNTNTSSSSDSTSTSDTDSEDDTYSNQGKTGNNGAKDAHALKTAPIMSGDLPFTSTLASSDSSDSGSDSSESESESESDLHAGQATPKVDSSDSSDSDSSDSDSTMDNDLNDCNSGKIVASADAGPTPAISRTGSSDSSDSDSDLDSDLNERKSEDIVARKDASQTPAISRTNSFESSDPAIVVNQGISKDDDEVQSNVNGDKNYKINGAHEFGFDDNSSNAALWNSSKTESSDNAISVLTPEQLTAERNNSIGILDNVLKLSGIKVSKKKPVAAWSIVQKYDPTKNRDAITGASKSAAGADIAHSRSHADGGASEVSVVPSQIPCKIPSPKDADAVRPVDPSSENSSEDSSSEDSSSEDSSSEDSSSEDSSSGDSSGVDVQSKKNMSGLFETRSQRMNADKASSSEESSSEESSSEESSSEESSSEDEGEGGQVEEAARPANSSSRATTKNGKHSNCSENLAPEAVDYKAPNVEADSEVLNASERRSPQWTESEAVLPAIRAEKNELDDSLSVSTASSDEGGTSARKITEGSSKLRSIFQDSMKEGNKGVPFTFFGNGTAATPEETRRAILERPKEASRPLIEIAIDVSQKIKEMFPLKNGALNFVAGGSATHKDWSATRSALTQDFRRKRKAAKRRTSLAKRMRFTDRGGAGKGRSKR